MAFMPAMVVPNRAFVVALGNALSVLRRDHRTALTYFGRSTDEHSSETMSVRRAVVIVTV